MKKRSVYERGRLTAKPANKTTDDFRTGVHSLGLDAHRDGLFYIPQHYHHSRPAALALMLHGANGQAHHGLEILQPYADTENIILVAPVSRRYSWDIIADNAFGADVIFIDSALSLLFSRFVIDATRIAIGGFSDGASYALCLGLSNGDLFSHIIAFSPGFAYTLQPTGKPAVFISHGIHDNILPISPCSRRIVPQLQKAAYHVLYKEFDGGHEIPMHVSADAVAWFQKGMK